MQLSNWRAIEMSKIWRDDAVRLPEIALADPEFEDERGRPNDKRSMLRQIAHALGTPEDAFLDESEAFATIEMTGDLLCVWSALTLSDRRLLLEMARGMISRG